MRIAVKRFRGEAPIVAHHLLPESMASSAVNCNLVSGDLDSFYDLGNPYQLAKAAPINTVFRIGFESEPLYLQWSESELFSPATFVSVSYTATAGDVDFNVVITGLDVPRRTNLYYATDPSQQGSNVQYAYPYVTFPLGLDNPTDAPTATTAATTGTTTTYEFAAPASVNNAVIVSGGAGYTANDILTVVGGTAETSMPAAQIKVLTVSGGAVATASLLEGGFYQSGLAPTSPAAVTGGTGAGATFTLSTIANTFGSFGTFFVDNGAGYYSHWTLTGDRWEVATGQGDLTVAYSTTDFGLSTCDSYTVQMDMKAYSGTAVPDTILWLNGTYTGGTSIIGPGVLLSNSDSAFTLYESITGTNGGAVTGTVIDTAALAIAADTFYRVTATMTASTSGTTPGFSASITIAASATPGTVLATIAGFIPYSGSQLGPGSNHRGNHNDAAASAYKNLLITSTQPAGTVTSESTNYVYTFVNSASQESGPSDPSDTITVALDTSITPNVFGPVQVTIPASPPGDDIVFYNLYRLVQLIDGSEVYEFVVQLDASSSGDTEYTDSTLDANLGAQLVTTDFAPPPSNLQGILALPNGIMAGFFDNVLALSAQGYFYAWPVSNQYPTDTPIVAIEAIDATVFILTESHPYTAWGDTPDAFSMSKELANLGCASARSVATHKRYGVIYSSGSGLTAFKAQRDVDLLRVQVNDADRPLFSIEQWQALDPTSIIGIVHDDFYYFWYDNGNQKGGYIVDLSPGGFSIIELDFHVTTAYVDDATDLLYLCPDFSVYPINGEIVYQSVNVLSQWEGDSPNLRPRTWTREQILLPRPATFMLARVKANDYNDVQLTVSSEKGTVYDAAVTDDQAFRLDAQEPGLRWAVEVTGKSVSNTVEIVEAVSEMITA